MKKRIICTTDICIYQLKTVVVCTHTHSWNQALKHKVWKKKEIYQMSKIKNHKLFRLFFNQKIGKSLKAWLMAIITESFFTTMNLFSNTKNFLYSICKALYLTYTQGRSDSYRKQGRFFFFLIGQRRYSWWIPHQILVMLP